MDIELSPVIDPAWLLGHTGGAQRFGISRSHRVSRKRDASEEIGDRQLGFDFEQLTLELQEALHAMKDKPVRVALRDLTIWPK